MWYCVAMFDFPDRYPKESLIRDVAAMDLEQPVITAGRLGMIRTMGKLTFAHIQDYSGKVQLVVKDDALQNGSVDSFNRTFHAGDIVGVRGVMYATKTGEKSILVHVFTPLAKTLRTLPEKWVGLKDQETRYRQRYLELIANQSAADRFVFRSRLIQTIRQFYWHEGFTEVETPILTHRATGAVAKPYHTHNEALDVDLFLRISHELPLKTLVVGGFDKIFELGKAFRNEGIDGSHLPEHTHLEHYAAYWNYEDNITFTEKMFAYLFAELGVDSKLVMDDGVEINLAFPWRRHSFIDLMKEKTGIDVAAHHDRQSLLDAITQKGHTIEGMSELSLAGLVDGLYKKVVRPTIINPTFLVGYPTELQPLARRSAHNPNQVDQFQLVINGWEIVKAYSELVDPVEQEARFKEQAAARKKGEAETMEIDEGYIEAMSYGMPPISGWGMGIDRLTALLTGKSNLREVVFFPLLREE